MKYQYSYSKIDLYNKCKLAFKLRYIDKLKEPETDALIIGRVAHDIIGKYLQSLVRQNRQTDIEELENIKQGYKDNVTEEQFSEIDIIIDSFSNSFLMPDHIKDIIIENDLAFNEKWERVEWLAPDVFFRAKMDLFFRNSDNTGTLTDWKTDRYLQPQSAIDKSFQLDIYSLLSEKLFPDIEENIIKLFYLRYGVSREAVRTKEDNFQTEQKLLKVIDKIEKEKDFSARLSSHCDYCGFKSLCPLYKKIMSELKIVDVNSDNAAYELAEKLFVAEQFIKDVKKRLKPWVEKNKGIVLGDSRLDFWLVEKTVFPDVEKVVNYMLDKKINKTDIWDNISISKTAIGKILKSSNQKDLSDDIMKMSILKPETHFKFNKVKE